MRFALALSLSAAVSLVAGTPALFKSGSLPVLPVLSIEVGGGEVLLEVTVDPTGAVTGVKPLRETATFTERMTRSVKTWHFSPAEMPIDAAVRKPGGPTSRPVQATVLVAGVFRPPALMGPTMGEPIRNVATASSDVPFPTSMVTPPFPPMVVNPGVALVEVQVEADGSVSDAKIRVPAPGFDSAALDAARQWKFRPAASSPAVAYIVFGFPVPTSTPVR
jgi:TonB family protein